MRVLITALLTTFAILISLPVTADWPMLQNNPEHTGYSPETGPLTDNLLWQWNPEEPGPITSHSMPPVSGGRVYTIVQGFENDNWDLTDGQVACLDAVTGEEIWRYHRGNDQKIVNHPVISQGNVFFACTTTPQAPWSGSSSLHCLDAETGTEIWAAGVNGTAGTVVVADSVVLLPSKLQYDYYYGIYYYYFAAYSAVDGTLLWTLFSDTSGFIRPCVHQGRIYTGQIGVNLLCLDALDGSTLWERALDPLTNAPTFFEDKVYYFASGEGLMALNPENGTTIWSNPELISYASIAAAEEQLFLVAGQYYVSGTVTAVDSASGAVNWSRTVAAEIIFEEPAVAANNLYAVSNNGFLYCLDTETGDTIWSHDTGHNYPGPPSVSDGRLYLANLAGGLNCYGTEDILTASLSCTPQAGPLPYDALVDLSLTNLNHDSARRFVYQINMTEPDGTFDLNWHRGWQNVSAGETWSTSFSHNVPGLEGNWGTLLFELEALDVTPAPYNQPPFPPDGRMVSDSCSAEIGLVDAALTCEPSSGTLPFASLFDVSMSNEYLDQARRFQYIIDITLGNGQFFPNWRRGWQNIGGGETHATSWWQSLPSYNPLLGINNFDLKVIDVTPAPYNQPPYPPAGDTATDSCRLTASGAP